ncbi:wax ester/triacylglycerol synthase domain-containing protein [Kitasatospora sp. NPDC002227]|uniref:wax ester/triacylglycerol synthase domain-containing protein n=1 Tax=Kitasatospora sp. NPDC002227 TaxID=3154773 RepID=UPI003317399E
MQTTSRPAPARPAQCPPTATPPAARRLAVQDRLLLKLARRAPDAAMHLGFTLLLDGPPPSLAELRRALATRVAALPELRLRLAERSGRRPRWEPDQDFEIGRHVYQLPGLDDPGPAAALAATLDHALPRDRPLWSVSLLRRPGGYALGYRAHHAFQDGLAAAETVEALFGPPLKPRPAGPAPDRPPRWDAELLRELLPPPRRGPHWSALDSGLSGARTAHPVEADLARLYAVGRATGANIHQLCLALLTATLRAWHPADWAGPGPGLRATVAVSVRPPDDPYRLLGNCSGVAGVPLPCPEADPLGQLELLREQVTFARYAELGRRHRVLYQRMPYWCGSLSLNRSIDPRRTPLTLADVRLRRELSFAGTPVNAVLPIPVSVPGQPLFVGWTTHRGRLHTTFLADTALPGAERLPQLWQEALATLELVAAEPSMP